MPSSNNKYLYLKLNNYIYSKENLKNIKDYLQNKIIPNEIIRKDLFKKRFDDFELNNNNKLIYKPLNLEVVETEEEKEKILNDLYNDIKIGTGSSVRNFYYKVLQKYLNIKRSDIENFLKDQPFYQITTHQKQKSINKPNISKYPNYKWSADLIDLTIYSNKKDNKKNKYILTVIDNFSRYAFAIPLKDKKPKAIIEAFNKIESKNKILPHILLSDNGSEFKNKDFNTWCETKDIKQIYSRSHTPTDNAYIERFNKTLRSIIREIFIRTDNLVWVPYLNDCLYNYNHSRHSTIKQIPADVWTPTKNKIEYDSETETESDSDIDKDKSLKTIQIQNKILEEQKNKAENQLKNYEELEKNDKVRYYLPSVEPTLRQGIKAGKSKNIIMLWSPKVYIITRKIKGTQFEKPKYKIVELREPENTDETILKTKFYGNELQKINKNDIDIDILPEKLNKLKSVNTNI
jgi:transposase InsO family protein